MLKLISLPAIKLVETARQIAASPCASRIDVLEGIAHGFSPQSS
jgi:hypothetical protein